MNDDNDTPRRHPGRAAGLGILLVLLVLLVAGEAWASKSKAFTLYGKAQRLLERDRFEEAHAALDKAMETEPDSFRHREGKSDRWYFPYFVRGKIYLGQGLHLKAKESFDAEIEQGVIQARDAEELLELENLRASIDSTPPLLFTETPAFQESRFIDTDDGVAELADFTIKGTVAEGKALASVVVSFSDTTGARENKLVRTAKRPGSDLYEFEVDVSADPTQPIQFVATDGAGNKHSPVLEGSVLLPPLSLGANASGVHALVIGVDTYHEDYKEDDGVHCRDELRAACGDGKFICHNLPDLGAAAKDARRFAGFLQLRGVPEENISVLISDESARQATFETVRRALDQLETVKGDKILFYFAGHGVHSESQDNLMLLSDTQAYECDAWPKETVALGNTSIGVNTVREALMKSDVQERYLILDACRTTGDPSTRGGAGVVDSPRPFAPLGGAGSGRVRGWAITEGLGKEEDRSVGMEPVVLWATLAQRPSIESTVHDGGYFTWFLLQAMRQDFHLARLQEWVQRRVEDETAKHHCTDKNDPGCELRQVPHIDWPDALRNRISQQEKVFMLRSEPR